MFKKYLIVLLFLISKTHTIVTIQASSLQCTTPTIINESAIIELDVALTIIGMCELIQAGSGFGDNDTVTFQPTVSNIITIQSTAIINPIGMISVENPGIWDIRSFNKSTQVFIFESVVINMNPGGTILADGVTFQLKGTSQIITNPVATPI